MKNVHIIATIPNDETSKGILRWIDDPKGYEEWNTKRKECSEKEKPFASALHKKFYSQYVIE